MVILKVTEEEFRASFVLKDLEQRVAEVGQNNGRLGQDGNIFSPVVLGVTAVIRFIVE